MRTLHTAKEAASIAPDELESLFAEPSYEAHVRSLAAPGSERPLIGSGKRRAPSRGEPGMTRIGWVVCV
jgi:hypothetical protein